MHKDRYLQYRVVVMSDMIAFDIYFNLSESRTTFFEDYSSSFFSCQKAVFRWTLKLNALFA